MSDAQYRKLVHAPKAQRAMLELTRGEIAIREALAHTVRETQGDLP